MRWIAFAGVLLLPLVAGCGKKTDKEGIVGNWTCIAMEADGIEMSKASFDGHRMIISPSTVAGRGPSPIPYTIDETKNPKELDIKDSACIYSLEGNILKIYHHESPDGPRPTSYATPPGAKVNVSTWQRE
jgi:uncharacterized protein (TIGR03067 family)